MTPGNETSPAWDEVDRYVKARLASEGDTYGWIRLDLEEPTALILTKVSTESQSFPTAIGGVRIQLRRVSPPERS